MAFRIVVLMACLILAACQTTGGQPDRYALVYSGESYPLSSPILLQYGDIENARVAFYIKTTLRSNRSAKSTEAYVDMSVKSRLIGETLLWEVAILEISSNGQRIRLKKPIIELSFLTDRHGTIDEITLGFPAHDAAGITSPLDANSSEVRELIKQAHKPYPKTPINFGDAVSELSLAQISDVFGKMGKTSKHREFLNYPFMRTIAVGLTNYRGRQALLTNIVGKTMFEEDGKQMMLSASGFQVIDLDTGLVLKATGSFDIQYRNKSGISEIINVVVSSNTTF